MARECFSRYFKLSFKFAIANLQNPRNLNISDNSLEFSTLLQ